MARRLRPITAVIVLYAFVLQGFLGGLLPVRMLDHAGFLCSQAAETARNGDDPIKVPAQHGAACCIAAHGAADAAPPVPAMMTLVWPLREASSLVSRRRDPCRRTGAARIDLPRQRPSDRLSRSFIPDPSDVRTALMNRIPRAELCAALLITLSATASFAHVTFERGEASPNATYRAVVQVNHGCSGKPTTRVSVTVPEGVIGAKPMPKPGWEVTTQKGPYARTYPYFHGDVSEGVKTITWAGGSLPDDQVDEFTFLARITDAFEPGSTVYFPVQQDCPGGSHSWSEIPAAGQQARSLKSPAPGVVVLAAQTGPATTGTVSSTVKAGDLTIETPWMRATPGGAKVAGGYVRITNSGSMPDRLTGAAIPLAGRWLDPLHVHGGRRHEDGGRRRRARHRSGSDRRAQARRLSPHVRGPQRGADGRRADRRQPHLRTGGPGDGHLRGGADRRQGADRNSGRQAVRSPRPLTQRCRALPTGGPDHPHPARLDGLPLRDPGRGT